MASTPYDLVPKKAFFIKMLAPAVAVFGLSIPVLGVIIGAMSSEVSGQISGRLSPIEAAFRQKDQFVQIVRDIPMHCWTGKSVNQFQVQQCNDTWKKVAVSGGLTAIPLVCSLLFFMIAFDSLDGVYRRARKKIKEGKALSKGRVADPSHLRQDLFSWVYGFKAVATLLADGQEVRVYVPQHGVESRSGDSLAIFDGGMILGEKRYLGLLYAPHVAVILGARD